MCKKVGFGSGDAICMKIVYMMYSDAWRSHMHSQTMPCELSAMLTTAFLNRGCTESLEVNHWVLAQSTELVPGICGSLEQLP